MLSQNEIQEIEHEIKLVPHKKAALIESLKIVQKHRGWISNDSVDEIAQHLGMSAAEVDSIATFYNLIFRKPVGKYLMLCNGLSKNLQGTY
jgi:NADH-quinone oxidoreductase subunit E